MIGPLARNVHEAGTQPLLDQAETSAHAQRTLILRTHAHLNPVQAELPNHQIKDERSNQGTQASSRPMSRVARKLAESSEEIPATAGLSLPALRGDAVVPPTKALPVVTRDEDDAN